MSFEQLPKELQEIINKYVKDLELVELYDKFYLKYKDEFNLTKGGYSNKEIEESQGNLPNRTKELTLDIDEGVTSVFYYGCSLDDKKKYDWIDKENKDNPTRFYSKISELAFPEDLKLFYRIFKIHSKQTSLIFLFLEPKEVNGTDAIYSLPADKGFVETIEELINYHNPHYGKEIFYKAWFNILIDPWGMNGGSIYTNLNPKAEEYGYIYSFSEPDAGCATLICKSFQELIKKLLEDNWKCDSVCDHLNKLCECEELNT